MLVRERLHWFVTTFELYCSSSSSCSASSKPVATAMQKLDAAWLHPHGDVREESSSWAEEPVRSRHILRTRPLGCSAHNPSLHNHRRRRRREKERGPGLQIIPEKGLKCCPSLTLLLSQPPTSSLYLSFRVFPATLSWSLAEDKQRNSRTSVCLYSR